MGIHNSADKIIEAKPRFGIRHWQAMLLFLGIMINFFQRVNISVALVPMTQSTAGAPYYDWSIWDKSLIQSSYLWGYFLGAVPGALLAKRFGAKIILLLASGLSGTLSFFHPMAAEGGWMNICVLRILTGLMQASIFPSTHTLLSKWVPHTERGFLTTWVYSGAQFGSAIIFISSGHIFVSSMGWPGIFYISGGISLAWCLLYIWQGADEPATSRCITKEEKEYIEGLTGANQNSQTLAVPWKSIFTSSAFYGLLAAHCGFTWGTHTLITQIPSYMSQVLQLNAKSNALLSSLPYFAMGLVCFVVSPISDLLINRKIISVTAARKLFNSISQWVPMCCLIGLGYMTVDDKTGAVVLLTFAVAISAAYSCGYLVNHMDLSPNFAGPMMGVSNCLSSLTSILAPIVVSAVITDEENHTQWRVVFFIAAGVYLLCNGLFVIFGKGTVQPWNDPSNSPRTMMVRNNSRITTTRYKENPL